MERTFSFDDRAIVTLFSGDLVEYGATPYCGDAHYKDWPETLQKLRDLKAEALVPGRGVALHGEQAVEEGIAGTQQFLADLYKAVQASAESGDSLKVAYDKAMTALEGIRDTLGLNYAGVDFATAPNGDLLRFDANATMVIAAPESDPRWA